MKNSEQPILTGMQQFFLDFINKQERPVYATYVVNQYYESIGKRSIAASRDSFGRNSAAYRTCRKLVAMGLIKQYDLGEYYSNIVFGPLSPATPAENNGGER